MKTAEVAQLSFGRAYPLLNPPPPLKNVTSKMNDASEADVKDASKRWTE